MEATMKPTKSPPPKTPRTRLALAIGAAVLVLLLGGATIWLLGSPQSAAVAGIGGPFQLVNGQGKPVTDQTFRGKYMLVYFGYTFCPDVCPTTLGDVADAMDKLGAKADRVQPLFITVDPARDTPAVVGQYAAAFSPRLQGLTGTPEQVAAVAHAYRVYYARHSTGPGPNDYAMDHSSILYLMGPDGRFIAPIRADQSGAELAADISRHLT
jgi:protein SCO1/2